MRSPAYPREGISGVLARGSIVPVLTVLHPIEQLWGNLLDCLINFTKDMKQWYKYL